MNSYGLIDLHCDTLADWKYANTGNAQSAWKARARWGT